MAIPSILVVNPGSSSIKFGLYSAHADDLALLAENEVDGAVRDPVAALHRACAAAPIAIGQRVVHGGPRLMAHQRITPAVLTELNRVIPLAPLHLPQALGWIAAAATAFPGVPQFACFDTAFHATLPELASRFALPGALFDVGIRRYGFHGLSYESIVHQLGPDLPARTVVAHLGGGASLAALRNGISVDTTMGLTPAGGIPMATRSGDLDPGLLIYLLRNGYPSADAVEQLVNHGAGLEALSGLSSDFRELEAAANSGHAAARQAIAIFAQAIAKTVASYAAILGGIDLLVFTGGIGEHSAQLRQQVTAALTFLKLPRIQTLPSREDLQIARHTHRLQG